MKKYIYSELLKTKKTTIRKLILIIPILCILIASLFSILGGDDVKELTLATTLNHWGLIWMPSLNVLICGLYFNLENRSTKYKTIIGFPISLPKNYIAKNIVVLLFTFISSLILGILFILFIIFIPIELIDTIPFYNYILTLFFSWFLTTWQVPFYLLMSQNINYFILLLINTFASLELGAGIAIMDNWFISPFSWTLRMQITFLKLHPNGIPLEQNSYLINNKDTILSCGLNILIFITFTLIGSQFLKRHEVI